MHAKYTHYSEFNRANNHPILYVILRFQHHPFAWNDLIGFEESYKDIGDRTKIINRQTSLEQYSPWKTKRPLTVNYFASVVVLNDKLPQICDFSPTNSRITPVESIRICCFLDSRMSRGSQFTSPNRLNKPSQTKQRFYVPKWPRNFTLNKRSIWRVKRGREAYADAHWDRMNGTERNWYRRKDMCKS